MREIIARLGPCTLELQPDGFQMLVRSITSQQISSSAARSILRRLQERVDPEGITPSAVRACGTDGMRACGYSARKASYILGIADAVAAGELGLMQSGDLSDEDVVKRLTCLRGVGEWNRSYVLDLLAGPTGRFAAWRFGRAERVARIARAGGLAIQAAGDRPGPGPLAAVRQHR